MAVTMAEITKLRKISGAGMMDCKNALTEANGDIDKAMEIIRKKGQAVAAKRSDREASEGCVLAKSTGQFAAIIALKCETDFVAKNADFVALTQAILDAAVANKCKTLDEVKALPLGNGTVQDAVTDRSGITGEKMELDGFENRFPNELSFGQQQRAAIARALTYPSPLLLMDEPFKGLDEALSRRIIERIRERQGERGQTILFTSHYPEDLRLLADKTVRLDPTSH